MLIPSLFESVFNSSTTGHALLSPTPEATILAVNDAFLKNSLRRREELLGVSVLKAFPGNPDDLDDTGEIALRKSLARVLELRESDTLLVQRYPIRIALPSGEVDFSPGQSTHVREGTSRMCGKRRPGQFRSRPGADVRVVFVQEK